jgi:very-short-patch-repair endonuclease
VRDWLNFTLEERAKIREAYKLFLPDIKAGIRRDVYAIWPHDWCRYMSPIENNVWQDIRSHGLPLYPQVPCGKYFIDFADPHRGIAIEVDGREWHQDPEKDAKRAEFIQAHGYSHFIRLPGNITFDDIDYERWADPDDEYQPANDSAEMTIVNLQEYYFGRSLSPFEPTYLC